jgi:small subunit ribosomal protein S15
MARTVASASSAEAPTGLRFGVSESQASELPPLVRQVLDPKNASAGEVQQMVQRKIMQDFRIHELDTGSPEVQIAVLSARISYLTGHLKQHKKDKSAQRGMLLLVQQRRRLLQYLRGEDTSRYEALVKRLNLRVSTL